MNLMDATDRYHSDPQFRAIVDQMIAMAMSLEMSPGELRQAAVFAEIKIAMMRPVRNMFPERAHEIEREMLCQKKRTD